MDVTLLESPDMTQALDTTRVQELRKKLKLTQTEIAEKAGMTVSRWNDIESGRKPNVTVDTLSTIAAALGCDARDLLTPKSKRKG